MKVYKSSPMPEAYARVEWCKAQFGGTGEPNWEAAGNGRAYCLTDGLRWWRRQGHLFFREEKDFLMYCLRWA